MKRFFFCFSVVTLLLTSCQNQYSENYLRLHPKILQKEKIYCDSLAIKTSAQTANCDMVATVYDDFRSLYSEYRENPELFGQKIMQAEIDYVNLKKELHKNEDNALRKKLVALKQEIKYRLAVVGIDSPQ